MPKGEGVGDKVPFALTERDHDWIKGGHIVVKIAAQFNDQYVRQSLTAFDGYL